MSSNIEALKNELIQQKALIEKKGGVILQANSNPSPSEITQGIESITMPDIKSATATEYDVLVGKTFYAGDFELKTGVMSPSISNDDINYMFIYPTTSVVSDKQFYYTFPESQTQVRRYLFNENPNKIQITLPTSLVLVNQYAFNNCINFTWTNINSIENVKTIENYGMKNVRGIDGECFFPNLQTIQLRGMSGTLKGNTYLNLPPLSTIHTYALAEDAERTTLKNIDFSKITASALGSYAFQYVKATCDFTPPECLKTINSYCFYRGGFNNVTIPSTCTTIGDYSFGSADGDAAEPYEMKTFTFESEVPPKIGFKFLSRYHVQNGCQIYVPDTALEEYKAISNMSTYLDIIHPMSERP